MATAPVLADDADDHDEHIAEKVLSFGIDEVVVTASPLARTADRLSQPVSVLDGTDLLLKRRPTIGETLRFLPGVASTSYGPGASRPIIRGLGGDRVRMLDGGLVSLDASAASDDHAVTVNPLALDRIEVLRGPAALRYGPNAVGGAINAIDERVPRTLVGEPLTGRLELRGGSIDESFNGAAVLKGSTGPLAYHLDAFGTTTDDLDIPGFARSKRLRRRVPMHSRDEAKDTLPNSATETTGFATGLSWVGDGFYLGAAPSLFRSTYGTVADEGVTIDLSQNRLDLAAGLAAPLSVVESVDAAVRLVDYHHTELEGAEAATRFENEGYDLRVEAIHVPVGRLSGALGFQSSYADFSAEGEEAFLPPTVTTSHAGFFLEEIDLAPVTMQIGARLDHTAVDSDGGARFGPGRDRSFVTGSGALGLVYDVTHGQTLSTNVAYTQRPPNYEELFARGPHIALDRFEIGDARLGTEDSLGLNVAYNKTEGRVVWSVNAFYNRFSNFITLMPTGAIQDDLPVERFIDVPAHFAGGEVEVAYHAIDEERHRLHFITRTDYVWAEDRDTDDPLPRLPPLRVGGSIVYQRDAIGAQLDVTHARPQRDVPDGALETDGYTMIDLSLTYELAPTGPVTPLLFLRATNLLDAEARDATSFLKDVAPSPGRGVAGGIRLTF